jgi:hypothetical protein
MEQPITKKKAGRPRKYANDKERVQASRERRAAAGSRLDVFLPRGTRARLEKFAKREGMSASEAVQIIISQCLAKDGKQKAWDYL